MKIGIDVDGVLTNLEDYQLKYGKKYFGEDAIVNENGYDIKDIFGCTDEEREKFWLKYIWGYCLKEPIREDFVEYINRLKAEGHEVHIITGRAHTTEQNITGDLFRKMLLYKLNQAGLNFDSITYCSEKESAEEKFEICKKLGIDIMFEDKKENIMALKKICKIICVNAKYNKDVIADNQIEKVNNSEAEKAYDIIEKYSNGNDCFKHLDLEEKENLSNEEKIKYFKDLRKFYQNLPYNKNKIKKEEKRYVMISNIGIPLFKFIYNPKVFNRDRIPTENGVIFVSNHLNYYDQFPIISAIGNRPIHFLTSTKMLALKRGLFYRLTGAVSIDRESKTDRRKSKEEISQLLVNGSNVFIFPEGRTNRNEKFLLDFKPGAVSIAQATGCPIVPIAVNDNYKSEKGELCVRFGEPIRINPTDDVIEKTDYLKEVIGTMVWENLEYNKEYQKKLIKKK